VEIVANVSTPQSEFQLPARKFTEIDHGSPKDRAAVRVPDIGRSLWPQRGGAVGSGDRGRGLGRTTDDRKQDACASFCPKDDDAGHISARRR